MRIELDTRTLQLFGAADTIAARRGIGARVLRLFKNLARGVENKEFKIDVYEPLINYIGKRYPESWTWAADLYCTNGDAEGRARAIRALTSLLESEPAPAIRITTWRRIAELAKRNGDPATELNAWMQVIGVDNDSLRDISDAANALNIIYRTYRSQLDRELLDLACERATAALAPHADLDANATDLSRLAWLYLNKGEPEKAKSVTILGLEQDPINVHLVNLKERLGI